MSFNYVRTNFNKLGDDHLYKFLVDVITRGQFDDIEDLDIMRRYIKGSKVYTFENGVHHIYECITEISTEGEFVETEWADIIDVFRGMNTDDVLNKMYITEELYDAVEEVNEIPIQYEGYEQSLCKVILFHSIQGRLSETEYHIENDIIYLHDLVMNPGEYMIIDIYEYDNKYHPNLAKPMGYVILNFTDLTGEEIRKPIVYKGDIGTLCEVLPPILNGYDFIEYEGEIDGVYDIDPKIVTFKYVKRY